MKDFVLMDDHQVDENPEWQDLQFSDIAKTTPIEPIFLKLMDKYEKILEETGKSEKYISYISGRSENPLNQAYDEVLSAEDANLSLNDLIFKYTNMDITSYSLNLIIPLQRLRPMKMFFIFFQSSNIIELMLKRK